jgi:protein-tyrosine phosphatase
VIDLHSHVLPGLDDGPETLDGSLELARAAVAAGTRVMAATPHVGLRYPVRPGELAAQLEHLRAALARAQIPLNVTGGGELAPGAAADLSVEDLQAITLGGATCILLECPFIRVGGLMTPLVTHLQRHGFRVLLAHPERSPEFLSDPASLAALVDAGAYVQITAASLAGGFGRTARRYSLALLDAGLVAAVSSDAHDAVDRPPTLLTIVDEVVRSQRFAPATTRFLTDSAPQALLTGAPVPPAPPSTRRPRWRR